MWDEVGLKLYDFHARQYDPQIGRFWGIDPADQFPSGYTGMGNAPGDLIDPDGCQVSMGGGVGGYTTAGVSGMSLSDFGEHWANVTILGDTRFDHPVNSLAWGLDRTIGVGTIGGGQGAGALVAYASNMMSVSYGYFSWGDHQIRGAISPTNNIYAWLDEYTVHAKSNATIARESAELAKYAPSQDMRYTYAMIGVIALPALPFIAGEIATGTTGAWAYDNLILNAGKIARLNVASGAADLSYQLATRNVGDVNIASVAGNTFLGPVPAAVVGYTANLSWNTQFFRNPFTAQGALSIGVGAFTNYGFGAISNIVGVRNFNVGGASMPNIFGPALSIGVNAYGNIVNNQLYNWITR